jgi:hypothetical protein
MSGLGFDQPPMSGLGFNKPPIAVPDSETAAAARQQLLQQKLQELL